MDTKKQPYVTGIIAATILTVMSSLVAIVAWRQINTAPLQELSTYEIFPLFGLLAFSLLWCLYTTDAIANFRNIENESLRPYYRITGYVLLVVLLAHPALLIIPLWRDGFGLPPGSYAAYVAPNLVWVVTLGTLALLAFLTYELRRWFKKRNWWKWVLYGNDIAMLAILYHGFTLGGELQSGWFQGVWLFYGMTFVTYVVYLRIYRPLSNAKLSQ